MSMSNTYTPRADSLAAHVVAFFKANPDEHLGLEDIVTKWQPPRGSIHTLLAKAAQAGLLARHRNIDGEYVYSAGGQIDAVVEDPPQASYKPAKRGGQRARHQLDIEALQVEEGIPYAPAARAPMKGRSKWDPLLAKLERPGQSVAIPGHVKAAVAKAITIAHREKRGTYKVATTGPDQACVWRMA